MRRIIDFNGSWQFKKTDTWESVTLPHTWNAIDGQDGGNDYYRGTCIYRKSFERPEMSGGERVWLEFNGAAHASEVSLNGKKLVRHKGGYSAFRVDITDAIRDENLLEVTLDNSDNAAVYPQKADFTFYGGLYRDVKMIIVPESHFALGYCGTPGIKVTPVVYLEKQSAEVTIEAWAENAEGCRVTFSADGKTAEAVVSGGYARAELTIENCRLWDGLDDPYLYTAVARLESGDEVSARFGCRKFDIDPEKGFILNGRSYPLRGVSRHQDRLGVGNALSKAHHDEDMAIIKELGANTLRLAHYQHSQYFYDLCDENGIIVWAEIPYITMHMSGGRENTLSQMEELVVQNYNHPSIAVWGLSNEITAASTANDELLENHRALNELCHRLDQTRKTTMANVFMLEIDSPILEIPDVNSYNLYFGWYLGELSQNDEFFDEYHEKYPNRAIGFSEYGADANPKYQSPNPEKGDYTESYQCVYHEHMLDLIDARPWLWATHVWNLFDFGADGRDEGGKNGQNQKGLVTFDRKLKKDAFYLYKAAWNKSELFVHLCGSRYADRAESVTEVKVYSNLQEVSLYVDDRLFETKSGRTVFKFNVPISGSHTVKAIAEGCSDIIRINKVDSANPEYSLPNRAVVVNWFDSEINPEYFSVNDKLADFQADSQARAVVGKMMAQGAQSRGDVATAVKDNPALIRMMGRMTLLSLLKQGGADEESIKQLNRVLQTFKKPEA